MQLQQVSGDNVRQITGRVVIEIRDGKTGKLKSRDVVKNLFVSTGKASIADRLAGDSSKGVITYCAVGTGTNVPALANTQLQTEIARKQIALREQTANLARFTTYFGTNEGNGVLREAGLFGDDADETANTGTLFCRLNITRTKTSADTLTIQWDVTIGA
jgi:hypothetical protein